ncbi:GroES-like protein [Sistotremastrum suecicum HHB10207 ss-3]|uniref:GroES-like protein n=1 Tax=Sistotremastrum suecicum HHB10207 ss-3 TaxID=1314776 RepID=A0A165XWW1_9AGAM|nr:GroES-like protein [Sistotremastrum suecicum HHB10207 ss-3]
MKAVVIQEDHSVQLEDRPIPEPGPDEILIKVIAAGLNHTDHKSALLGNPGTISGCDAVGEVVKLGSNVPDHEVKKGEKRFAFVRGAISETNGAFSEYMTCLWDGTSLIPPSITPQEAASIPIPFATAMQCLYYKLPIPEYPHRSNGEWIVIWSGASAVGQYAIQLARLAGLRIATTASPSRWKLVQNLGADVVVDYKDPEVIQKLRNATNDSIQYGIDCISQKGTPQLVQQAFRPEGGDLVLVLFNLDNLPRPEVKTRAMMGYNILGYEAQVGDIFYKAVPEQRAMWVRWCKLCTKLFGDGQLKPLDVEVIGGLDQVQKGFELLRTGNHSKKIVFNVG